MKSTINMGNYFKMQELSLLLKKLYFSVFLCNYAVLELRKQMRV